ncbi:MAG TPA: SRPBCC domain-containing protein, partial [Chloroflexota bacterium]
RGYRSRRSSRHMRYYEATSDIAASPESVWAVLVDGTNWTSWDSGVEGLDGRIAPGETITIRSHAAPGRAFPVKVVIVEAPTRLQFSGGMPLGLFRGIRTYTLSPNASGGTTFHLREEYTGPLVGLMWRSMPDLSASFTTFANGLKQRVEAGI